MINDQMGLLQDFQRRAQLPYLPPKKNQEIN